METIASQHLLRPVSIRGLVVGLAAAGLLAGCTAAAVSPSPTTRELPSSSPRASTQTTAATMLIAPPTASPTPTAAFTPFPSVGNAPTGQWTGINWISAGPVFDPTLDNNAAQLSVFGWSRGYVGFRSTIDQSSAAAPSAISSTDGLHWTASPPMDTVGLEFAVRIGQVVEGPSGLLAVGRYQPGVCGGSPAVAALWSSTDGLAWSRVQLPVDFASNTVNTVDGGSSGYIASGELKDGVTQAVWLSVDGRSWRQVPLPNPSAGGVIVDGATNFAGVYVLFGAQRIDVGCGASDVTPSLWWSTDGRSWTRSKLTGGAPASNAQVTVSRISDHSLMAMATEWNDATQLSSQLVWVTADGRTWKLVESPSTMLGLGILTNGQCGLVVRLPSDSEIAPTIATVGDDLRVTTLSQTGDGPIVSTSSSYWVWALGPTGVLILNSDGSDSWLGVPTAS